MSGGPEWPKTFGALEAVPWGSILDLAAQGSISALLNGLGHELNNSLTPVLGYAQLIQDGGMTETQCKLYAQRIASAAEEISGLLGAMLLLVRRHNIGPDLTNINELIQETLVLQRYEIEKHEISVNLHLATGLPPTVIDPYEVQIVFLNVVQNAIQALADSERERAIVVFTGASLGQPGYLSIEFADSGPGIQPRILPHVFEPFFTTKKQTIPSAVGLGLTLCRHFVHKQGGTISIQSQPGIGTQVTIGLPIRTALPDVVMSSDSPL